MAKIGYSTLMFLSMFLASVHAQETTTPLYAVPLLGLFVTSMIVVIVWLMYKDKLDEPQ